VTTTNNEQPTTNNQIVRHLWDSETSSE